MKIKFNPTEPRVVTGVTPPKPAREYLPEWYKSIPAFENNKPEFNSNGRTNKTVKMCMPFADSMTAGYIQEAWQDIFIDVKEVDGEYGFRYSVPGLPESIGVRDNKPSIPLGDAFYPIEFTFHPTWVPELPKGWSILYTQPFNRLDLPFQFASGIVDADTFTQSLPKSNFPFYVRKGFNGVIPKGTPMYQMIPFKRENWESSLQEHNGNEQNRILAPLASKFWGGYKSTYWNKKTYK